MVKVRNNASFSNSIITTEKMRLAFFDILRSISIHTVSKPNASFSCKSMHEFLRDILFRYEVMNCFLSYCSDKSKNWNAWCHVYLFDWPWSCRPLYKSFVLVWWALALLSHLGCSYLKNKHEENKTAKFNLIYKWFPILYSKLNLYLLLFREKKWFLIQKRQCKFICLFSTYLRESE